MLAASSSRRGRLSSFDEAAHLVNDHPSHARSMANLAPMPEQEMFEEKKSEESFHDDTWDKTRIWEWYNNLPWLAGMNYLPRTAVNFVEMWDESSFDPDVIAQELGWASEKLGYNTLRTNIPMCLYEHDAEGLTKRINKFLRIAARNGFVVMLCPLDDCEFSGEQAHPGPQPEPIPGLHNSRAIGSPGRRIVLDPSQWYRVEEYVRYMVRTWGQDRRILLWDLYNEPGNPWIFRTTGTELCENTEQFEMNALLLMEKVFHWAREENPSQPLTTSAWHMPDPFFEGDVVVPLAHAIDQRAMELSDVISIHAYCDPTCLQTTLMEISHFGKPMLLTEWMARQVKSTYETTLPTLKELKVGAYQWGLVRGKTQTHLPWPHVAKNYEGDPMWWHDILDADGSVHCEKEAEVIRSFAFPQSKAFSSDMFMDPEDSMLNLEAALEAAVQHAEHEGMVPINEGEEAVVPSVCSISMAAISSAMSHAGLDNTMLEHSGEPDGPSLSRHHSFGVPSNTFGSHMRTKSVEGLDLALGGIEF
jgi:hypothetical protein